MSFGTFGTYESKSCTKNIGEIDTWGLLAWLPRWPLGIFDLIQNIFLNICNSYILLKKWKQTTARSQCISDLKALNMVLGVLICPIGAKKGFDDHLRQQQLYCPTVFLRLPQLCRMSMAIRHIFKTYLKANLCNMSPDSHNRSFLTNCIPEIYILDHQTLKFTT